MKCVFLISGWAMPRAADPKRLFEDNRGLTGSETALINYARQISLLGVDVTVRGRFTAYFVDQFGVKYEQESTLDTGGDFDLAIAWIDPRPLVHYPNATRVLNQQVNDFSYCDGWEGYVDYVTSPSATHREYMRRFTAFPEERWFIAYNGVDSKIYHPSMPVIDHKMIYASSPDRGLHWLLEAFPRLKARVPDLELHVYYDWEPFYQAFKNVHGEIPSRLRYCHEMFGRLKGHGVYHHASVSKQDLRRAMWNSRVLAYPCDPVSFTEGFSVTTLEAAALGCPPVLIGADALPEIYGTKVPMIPAPYQQNREAYEELLFTILTDDARYCEARYRGQALAQKYDWLILGKQFLENIK